MFIMDKQVIGERLYAKRKAHGLTQSEVAEISNISDRTYADIERGTTNMRVDTLCKICKALNVTPNDILLSENKDPEELHEKIISSITKCSSTESAELYEMIRLYLKALKKF